MLRVPQSVTRPTTGRVREAIFSTLQHEIGSFDDQRILDLYAGSGALGLEAMSRGASSVVFVEKDRKAVDAIQTNVSGFVGIDATVIRENVATVVNAPASSSPFDLVFMDPPYSVVDAVVEQQIALLVKNGWLTSDAMIVVERDTDSELEWPEQFQVLEPRVYGDTAVWYGRYGSENSGHDSEGATS